MDLTEKIDSLEKYLEATYRSAEFGAITVRNYKRTDGTFVLDNGITAFRVAPGNIPQQYVADRLDPTQWWLHRELLRARVGVYPKATRVLTFLSNVSQLQCYVPHISHEDRDLIAFTASPEDGVRDRQTRMALGRFLRRFSIGSTDKIIAALEAAHRAEANPKIEFIVAETHPNEFLAAYQAQNSCMSKSTASYGDIGKAMHPVLGYCTPGFQLAVLKNGDGALDIGARSLVWINPEDPTDMRMVRTYGDTALTQILESKGFKYKHFEGAWLKTKIVRGNTQRDGREMVVAPYVDPGSDPAGISNGWGVWDGEEKIFMLSSKTKLSVPNEYKTGIQSANGAVYMKAFPINRACAITGEMINAMKEPFREVWLDGKMAIARSSAVMDWKMVYHRDRSANVLMRPDTATFKHGGYLYEDTDANRLDNGFVRLDATLYPDQQDWLNTAYDANIISVYVDTTRMRSGYVKREDTINVIHGERKYVYHVSTLPKDAVRVSSIDDVKTWAMPNCQIVTTAANRKVVPGAHPVQQAYDGKWYYTRHLQQTTFLGTTIWIPKDSTLGALTITELPAAAKVSCATAVNESTNRGNAVKRAIFKVFARNGDMLAPSENANEDTLRAGYFFDWRDLPSKLIEKWLKEDFKAPLDAPPAKMELLHKFGRLVVAEVEQHWAAKVAATTPKVTEEVAEPVTE